MGSMGGSRPGPDCFNSQLLGDTGHSKAEQSCSGRQPGRLAVCSFQNHRLRQRQGRRELPWHLPSATSGVPTLMEAAMVLLLLLIRYVSAGRQQGRRQAGALQSAGAISSGI